MGYKPDENKRYWDKPLMGMQWEETNSKSVELERREQQQQWPISRNLFSLSLSLNRKAKMMEIIWWWWNGKWRGVSGEMGCGMWDLGLFIDKGEKIKFDSCEKVRKKKEKESANFLNNYMFFRSEKKNNWCV